MRRRKALTGAAMVTLIAGIGIVGVRESSASERSQQDPAAAAASATAAPATAKLRFTLAPSSAQLAACMPKANVQVTVLLQDEQQGRDVFKVNASGLPPNTDFTTFLLERPADPFGAAEYIGDFQSDGSGKAQAQFRLIVQEAFASTVVNGQRLRVDLNHVGMWFSDPAADDTCLGPNGGKVTPFDGDGEAGVQVFNSANALPADALP